MAEADHAYHRGQQDITEQAATFRTFGTMTKWACLIIGALLVLLITWLCAGAGFFAGFIAAVVILAIGVFFLRSGPDQEAPIGNH